MSTAAATPFEPNNMVFRHLGRTGLKVSLFSLGSWITLGGSLEGDPVADCIKAAWDSGINFFDTAENYSSGQAEIELGQAIKKLGLNRRELVISSKVFFGAGRKDPNDRGLSRKHVIEGVQDCLQRLQMDYVDLIFAHRPDVATPMLEIVRAFSYVIDQGWAFYWGTSEWSAAEIQEAFRIAEKHNLHAPVVEQPQYNLLCRERIEKEYAPLFQREGLGTTIWSPLASGLVTGKYNDGIPPNSRFAKEPGRFKKTIDSLNQEDGQKTLDKVKKIGDVAGRLEITQTALALAWCAKNPNISSVILGASDVAQVTENLKALEALPKLTDEVMEEIDQILGNKPSSLPTYNR